MSTEWVPTSDRIVTREGGGGGGEGGVISEDYVINKGRFGSHYEYKNNKLLEYHFSSNITTIIRSTEYVKSVVQDYVNTNKTNVSLIFPGSSC